MATHPSEPETVAFLVTHNASGFDPATQVEVCTTPDLGKTTLCTKLGDVDTTSPFLIGLGYDRLSDKNLVAAFKGSKSKIFVSTNGGLFFSEKIPFPDFGSTPINVLWAGATSALMARAIDRVLFSNDLGVTYPTQYWHSDCYPPGTVSGYRGSLAVDAADHTVMLLTCDDGSAKRCVGSSCEVSSLPPGLKIQAVTLSPGDPSKAAALASDGDKLVLLASSDGGKTFTAGKTPALKAPALNGLGAGYLVHDPRPSSAYVYAGLTGQGTLDLLRSFDDGQSWEVITPPTDIAPTLESFFPVEFDVASDGAVLALTKTGELARLPPPACLADTDCAAESPRCDVSAGKCVACLVNADCGLGWPSCDPVTKQCTNCVDDKGCEGRPEGRHCHVSGSCECASDDECADSPLGSHCVDLFKICGCATTADCKGATYPLCDAAEPRCVPPCVTNADCYQNAGGPVCDAAGSQLCVECVADSDCIDNVYGTKCIAGKNRCGCGGPGDCAAPLGGCDLLNQICVGCLADDDCAGNPQGQVCNEQEKLCVVCAADVDCKNPAEPYCNVPPGYPQSAYCGATPDPLALRRQEVGAQRSAPQC